MKKYTLSYGYTIKNGIDKNGHDISKCQKCGHKQFTLASIPTSKNIILICEKCDYYYHIINTGTSWTKNKT